MVRRYPSGALLCERCFYFDWELPQEDRSQILNFYDMVRHERVCIRPMISDEGVARSAAFVAAENARIAAEQARFAAEDAAEAAAVDGADPVHVAYLADVAASLAATAATAAADAVTAENAAVAAFNAAQNAAAADDA